MVPGWISADADRPGRSVGRARAGQAPQQQQSVQYRDRRQRRLATGLLVGALVALGFAVAIRLLPGSVFLQSHWRLVVYVVCAAAPPTALFLQWIARARGLASLLVAGEVMLGRRALSTARR